MQFQNGDERPLATRLGSVAISAAFLAVGILVARELFPHHAQHRAASATMATESSLAEAPTGAQAAAPTPPAPTAATPVVAAAPTSAPAPKIAAIPLAATVISQVVANPEAFAPSHVFGPPAAPQQIFNYEPLPPFNSTTLKRTRTNPAAWELDAMHGPKMNDLGPAGAVHQAAVARDSIGNETPWYSIDSGPLAPAYAVMQAGSVRVMSRAFMVANRSELPPEVASELDR